MHKREFTIIATVATARELNQWLNCTQHLTQKQRFKLRHYVGRLLNGSYQQLDQGFKS